MTDGPQIEPATLADLDALTNLLYELFEQEADFTPDRHKQMRALQLILENPSRGRIFVLRLNQRILGMVNLLFTISTAEGGFAMLLEDLIIRRDYRGNGLGSRLLKFAIDFAREKGFVRVTLLTDRDDERSVAFYRKHGFFVSKMVPLRMVLNSDTPGATV